MRGSEKFLRGMFIFILNTIAMIVTHLYIDNNGIRLLLSLLVILGHSVALIILIEGDKVI